MSPQTFIFFGPSGSGKGAQARLLVSFLEKKDPLKKVLYLETGEKLREFAKEGSLSARKTKEIINRGELMPEFIPVWLWTQYFVDSIQLGDEHIILDGIARRSHEGDIMESTFRFYDRKNPSILSMNVSFEWAKDKLDKRGRDDDEEEDIKRRFAWYKNDAIPVLQHFRNNPYYQFLSVNGEQSIEEVHKEILRKIGLK